MSNEILQHTRMAKEASRVGRRNRWTAHRRDNIWPVSQIFYALTSNSDPENAHSVRMLKAVAVATGLIYESYDQNNSAVHYKSVVRLS